MLTFIGGRPFYAGPIRCFDNDLAEDSTVDFYNLDNLDALELPLLCPDSILYEVEFDRLFPE